MVADVVHTNGFLGWVQGTGKQPSDGQPVTADSVPNFEDYGLGCFLLGGSEIAASRRPDRRRPETKIRYSPNASARMFPTAGGKRADEHAVPEASVRLRNGGRTHAPEPRGIAPPAHGGKDISGRRVDLPPRHAARRVAFHSARRRHDRGRRRRPSRPTPRAGRQLRRICSRADAAFNAAGLPARLARAHGSDDAPPAQGTLPAGGALAQRLRFRASPPFRPSSAIHGRVARPSRVSLSFTKSDSGSRAPRRREDRWRRPGGPVHEGQPDLGREREGAPLLPARPRPLTWARAPSSRAFAAMHCSASSSRKAPPTAPRRRGGHLDPDPVRGLVGRAGSGSRKTEAKLIVMCTSGARQLKGASALARQVVAALQRDLPTLKGDRPIGDGGRRRRHWARDRRAGRAQSARVDQRSTRRGRSRSDEGRLPEPDLFRAAATGAAGEADRSVRASGSTQDLKRMAGRRSRDSRDWTVVEGVHSESVESEGPIRRRQPAARSAARVLPRHRPAAVHGLGEAGARCRSISCLGTIANLCHGSVAR